MHFIFILKYNYEPSALPVFLKSKIVLCEKEPMPQNNEVYCSSYVEHHLKKREIVQRPENLDKFRWALT